MLEWIIFAVVGKLILFLWMKFPLPQVLSKIKFIESLHACSLCSGVWVYVALSALLRVDVMQAWFEIEYVIGLSEFLTGCITSYVVFLLSVGFTEAHTTVIIEG